MRRELAHLVTAASFVLIVLGAVVALAAEGQILTFDHDAVGLVLVIVGLCGLLIRLTSVGHGTPPDRAADHHRTDGTR